MYAQISALPTSVIPTYIDSTSSDFVYVAREGAIGMYDVDWDRRYSPDDLLDAAERGRLSGDLVAYLDDGSLDAGWFARVRLLSDNEGMGSWGGETLLRMH